MSVFVGQGTVDGRAVVSVAVENGDGVMAATNLDQSGARRLAISLIESAARLDNPLPDDWTASGV